MSQPASPFPVPCPDLACAPQASQADEESGCSISSDALLAGRPSITIDHQGMQYILRATRAGKLILTK